MRLPTYHTPSLSLSLYVLQRYFSHLLVRLAINFSLSHHQEPQHCSTGDIELILWSSSSTSSRSACNVLENGCLPWQAAQVHHSVTKCRPDRIKNRNYFLSLYKIAVALIKSLPSGHCDSID